MAREQISLEPAEVTAFLSRQSSVVLVTLRADGSPTGALVPSALVDGQLLFAVAESGEDFENLQRDPRACCSSDEFSSYYEIKGATVHGNARPVRDPGALRGCGLESPGQAVFALELDDVLSFDFSKIQKKY